MTPDASDVLALVATELRRVRDPVVLKAMTGILVPPVCREVGWDYGESGQTYPCWRVAIHEPSETEYVYCHLGFGPSHPWGILALDWPSMGMDCGWYPSLVAAFLESFGPVDLPIWDVVRDRPDGRHEIVLGSLPDREAWALRRTLRRRHGPRFQVRAREFDPDGLHPRAGRR